MLCLSHKFVEIHVPRTGGTSRKESLKKAGCRSEGDNLDHEPADVIANQLGARWNEFYKFSFRRNPCELALSLFHYRRDRLEARNPHKVPNEFTFDDWVKAYVRRLPAWKCRELSNHSFYWGEPALGVEVFDFADMAEVWPMICDKIGVNAPLQNLNGSGASKDWRKSFTAETFELVKARFQIDTDRFGWPESWNL